MALECKLGCVWLVAAIAASLQRNGLDNYRRLDG